MLRAGYRDEAQAWRTWLLRAVAGDPADVQIMYGIAGERRLDERELEWLPGYEGSRPVRVGNAASTQLQLDVYGEVLDAALPDARARRAGRRERLVARCGSCSSGSRMGGGTQDAGIWEVRGPNRHFTHSKVMAWVAFDRAVRFHEEFGREGPVDRWRALRDEIHAEVLDRAWSEKAQAFTQSYDSDELDASVLLMPLVGFLPATDARIVLDRRGDPARADGRRAGPPLPTPRTPAVDGLPGGEGVFLPCSFWLAGVLALQGKHDEARELFERLLDLRNDVGLLSEEYDPRQRPPARQLPAGVHPPRARQHGA